MLFQKTRATETGISNYHKLISTFFKSGYTRLTPEIIYYRNFKNSNEKLLVKDLGNSNIAVNSEDPPREFCPIHFLKPYKKHTPIKKKILGGKYAPFIMRELSNEIDKRCRLRNFGNIHLINFCLKPKVINVSRCGENALKLTFNMSLIKALL